VPWTLGKAPDSRNDEITSVTFGQSVLCESLAVKFGLIRAEFVYMLTDFCSIEAIVEFQLVL
jgi:hypothetical protein